MIQAGKRGMFTVNPAGQPRITVLRAVRYYPIFRMGVFIEKRVIRKARRAR